MKILLCEDDANIATIAKICLSQIGQHEVVHADNGELALEKAKTEKFDVILLDEMMPKMNGVEVCRILNELKDFTTPVIFMSANPQQKRVEEFSRITKGFIPKPFDPMTLNTQMMDILKSQNKAAS